TRLSFSPQKYPDSKDGEENESTADEGNEHERLVPRRWSPYFLTAALAALIAALMPLFARMAAIAACSAAGMERRRTASVPAIPREWPFFPPARRFRVFAGATAVRAAGAATAGVPAAPRR